MSDKFMTALKETSDEINNIAYSENGAQMLRTTGSALLDLNFSVPELRNDAVSHKTACDLLQKFALAWKENERLALKWLFYARDIRGGLGERAIFRAILNYLACMETDIMRPLIKYIPDYGRWDDVFCLMNTPLEKEVLALIREQLVSDIRSNEAGAPVSLLAKWLPSNNTSSKTSRRLANKIMRFLAIGPKTYRTRLSELRKALNVTEVKMSANEWDTIDYPSVPSRANLLYRKAFEKHDIERYRDHLLAVLNGKANMNSGDLYPHEIIAQSGILHGNLRALMVLESDYPDLEAMWQSLPNVVNPKSRTIVVLDTSGSMYQAINSKTPNTYIADVACGLAIYFSGLLNNCFKDQVITFSEKPRLLDLSGCEKLTEKLGCILRANEVANTNIEAVFDLILQTAIENHVSQEELPTNVLIISDMEFDACISDKNNLNLFDTIYQRYEAVGYHVPRLCFWNVGSRTGAIPVKENELGCVLMSGYSIHLVDLVMGGKLDPYEALVDVLESNRYKAIDIPVK